MCGFIVVPTSSHPSRDSIDLASALPGAAFQVDGSRFQIFSTTASCSRRWDKVFMSDGSPVDDEQPWFGHFLDRVLGAFASQPGILHAAVRHVIDPPGGHI